MKITLQPSEYNECVTLVDYLSRLREQGKVKMFTHVPNETYTTSWAAKTKNKMMGVARGFPDYVIVTRKGVIYLEMKTKKGKLSEDQKNWLEILPASYVAYGYDHAKEIIDEAVKNSPKEDIEGGGA